MNSSQQLAKRLREVVLSGKWVANTNFKEQLTGLTWEQAVLKSHNLNSIADLTFHVDYYIAGVLQVLRGGKLEIHDKFSFDRPEIKNQSDWQNLVNKLMKDAEDFCQALETMPEEKLQENFAGEKYGNYALNINVIIEHCYYHLGQVVLLKKMRFGNAEL